MEKIFLDALERFSLLESAKGSVTVALSGGADSCALLHLFLKHKEQLNITVKAAHLNHLIRGDEAFRDEEFVKKLCEKYGVELFVGREDVPKYAAQNGISIELAARKLRYEFLESVCDGVVATAHTASDNLETLIFNLVRGSALKGLCGIPPKRDIFIRPIIMFTRAQIEEYCEKNGIDYITDSTNLCDDYTRNKIRHKIVPLLKELNPSVENSVLKTSVALKEFDDVITLETENLFYESKLENGGLSVKTLKEYQPAIIKNVIKHYCKSVNPEIELENVHIEGIYIAILNTGKINLPKNYFAVVKDGVLQILADVEVAQNTPKYVVDIAETENKLFQNTKNVNNLLLKNSLDCDKIIGKLVIRTRKAGDKLRLLNRGCTKTLNALYNEYRIPVEQREILPVISDDGGVVWIHGIGIAQRCAVTDKTKRIFNIEVSQI